MIIFYLCLPPFKDRYQSLDPPTTGAFAGGFTTGESTGSWRAHESQGSSSREMVDPQKETSSRTGSTPLAARGLSMSFRFGILVCFGVWRSLERCLESDSLFFEDCLLSLWLVLSHFSIYTILFWCLEEPLLLTAFR